MSFLDYFRPKWKHSNPDTRIKYIAKITDQHILAEIVRNDKDVDVRLQAVKNIYDDDMLVKLMKNEKNNDIREEAIKKITDQDCLVETAQNDENEDSRLTAINRIKNVNALYNIAKNEKVKEICDAAIYNIKDIEFLAKIALDTKNKKIKKVSEYQIALINNGWREVVDSVYNKNLNGEKLNKSEVTNIIDIFWEEANMAKQKCYFDSKYIRPEQSNFSISEKMSLLQQNMLFYFLMGIAGQVSRHDLLQLSREYIFISKIGLAENEYRKLMASIDFGDSENIEYVVSGKICMANGIKYKSFKNCGTEKTFQYYFGKLMNRRTSESASHDIQNLRSPF